MGNEIVERLRECAEFFASDYGYPQAETCNEAAALIERQKQRIRELEGALKPYLFGDPTLEQILWGDQPDDAPMQITVPLGAHRAVRAVLQKEE